MAFEEIYIEDDDIRIDQQSVVSSWEEIQSKRSGCSSVSNISFNDLEIISLPPIPAASPSIPSQVIMSQPVQPFYSTLVLSESSLLAWETDVGVIGPSTNKFVLTSQSLRLPWTLEGVIRDESPNPFNPNDDFIHLSRTDLTRLLLQQQSGQLEEKSEPRRRSRSVLARTIRFPLVVASDMVIFLLKLMWGQSPALKTFISPSDL